MVLTDALMEVQAQLIELGLLSPTPNELVMPSRHRITEYVAARDEDKAVAEMGATSTTCSCASSTPRRRLPRARPQARGADARRRHALRFPPRLSLWLDTRRLEDLRCARYVVDDELAEALGRVVAGTAPSRSSAARYSGSAEISATPAGRA
jgi:hypothetical protein